MNETHRIEGVVFDLDGTLYALRARQLRITVALWRWSDLRVLRHLLGTRSWMRSQTFADREAFFGAFCAELGRRAGISPLAAGEWYENRFLGSFVKMLAKRARIRPGLLGLLARLRQNGVKLAVVSDYGYVRERLAALSIPLDAFDELCSSEDYGALKPSPRPLIALAEDWGLDPKHVVMIGDREDLDQASALAAGMDFLGISDRSGPEKDGFTRWSKAVKFLEDRTKPDNWIQA
ncbi:MAG: HAD family hydrolase [Proteobacteria bacterium]|nr:HAD family hydrolase [Pseudomonadota bacterium]